jgi:hypothetical protein
MTFSIRIRRRVPLASLLLLSLLTGCGEGTDQAPTVMVRDSAGIRLSEASRPETIDSTPWAQALLIGREDAGPEYRFDEIAGLVLRSDGSLVVANGGTQEIRFFDAQGAYQHSVGRAGSGPGEYSRTIRLLPYTRDSLLVWDFTRRQVTVLDRDGGLARSFAITEAEPNPGIVGAYPDGTLLVGSRHLRLAPGDNADSVVFQRLAPDGRSRGSIGWFRTSIIHFQMTDAGPVIDDHPFIPRADVAVVEGGFVVALGDRAVLQRVDLTGRLAAEHRWAVPATPLDPGAVATWTQDDLARQSSDAARARRQAWLDDLAMPANAPVISQVRIATDATRWIRRFSLHPAAAEFDLLAADGRWLRTVSLPATFELLAATATAAAGILRDADGVERVAVYRHPDR